MPKETEEKFEAKFLREGGFCRKTKSPAGKGIRKVLKKGGSGTLPEGEVERVSAIELAERRGSEKKGL